MNMDKPTKRRKTSRIPWSKPTKIRSILAHKDKPLTFQQACAALGELIRRQKVAEREMKGFIHAGAKVKGYLKKHTRFIARMDRMMSEGDAGIVEFADRIARNWPSRAA